MLRRNIKLIALKNLKNSLIIKYNIKNIILKSIFHNRQIENKQRIFSSFFFTKQQFTNKIKNSCLLSGRNKSTNNKVLLSRHNMNKVTKLGLLTNFKIKS
jgi:ribosomal protein S14